jgi:RNA polymerase sigma factor (sigma-70 family)
MDMTTNDSFERVPEDYDQLFRIYGADIARQLKNTNKVPANAEDIFQSIALRLVEADIIGKFQGKVARSRPETLTTEEVAAFLGITVTTWIDAQTAFLAGDGFDWMPAPIAGDPTSDEAIWSTTDIETFEATGGFETTAGAVIPRATATKFRQYLTQCVHNAFVNWVRTKSRRHKERVVEFHAGRHFSARMAQGGPAPTQEEMFDFLEPNHAHEDMERTVEIRHRCAKLRVKDSDANILSLFVEGYTATEIAENLGVSKAKIAQLRQRVASKLA